MTVLRPEEETRVRELFAALERPVELLVALGPEETPLPGSRDVDFGAETVRICEGLAELGDAVTCRVGAGAGRVPALPRRLDPAGGDATRRPLRRPPVGLRARLARRRRSSRRGRREPALRPESRAALEELDRDLALDVFVTPT